MVDLLVNLEDTRQYADRRLLAGQRGWWPPLFLYAKAAALFFGTRHGKMKIAQHLDITRLRILGRGVRKY